MAGFKTHITVSSLLGVGYGGAAYFMYGVPWPTCALAGGLCGVSGMLPDIDSDSGTPLRESMAFAAAVVPMMLLHRFQHWGMSHELIILAGAAVYLLIRFGFSALLETLHGPSRHVPQSAGGRDLRRNRLPAGLGRRLAAAGLQGRRRGARLSLAPGAGRNLQRRVDRAAAAEKLVRHGAEALRPRLAGPILSAYAKLALLTAVIFFEPQWPQTLDQPGNAVAGANRAPRD